MALKSRTLLVAAVTVCVLALAGVANAQVARLPTAADVKTACNVKSLAQVDLADVRATCGEWQQQSLRSVSWLHVRCLQARAHADQVPFKLLCTVERVGRNMRRIQHSACSLGCYACPCAL